MEYGSIEREIFIDAAPELVFDVVSDPAHVKRWWPDDAEYDVVPGATGRIVFGDCAHGGVTEQLTIVDVRPPRSFSYRWTYPAAEPAAEDNSLLVTFDLAPQGAGTLLRMTESGFRERGWSAAVMEQCYNEHVTGWDFFLPRLESYASTLRPEVKAGS
ncbi:SRPBCC family protein [Actinoplanes sp. NPDC023801]|uniref:SRPBCC family protein n=1 Tax=Actinoplanes sp. NPDC023801 TaxID=3154595 RepID=UPI0033E5B027